MDLYNGSGERLLAMRYLSGGEGMGSHTPRRLHFGLADAWGGPGATYRVRAHFTSGRIAEARVVPAMVQSTVGSTTLVRTLTLVEP